MGYYKDTGSLQSMASAEAILKKRMPEKVGILPVAELLSFLPFRESETIQRETSCLDRA